MAKIIGWFGVAIAFVFLLPYPLILLGLPLDYAWPIAIALAFLLLVSRPGGTVEKFIAGIFTYGLLFAIWCVGGVFVVVALNLIDNSVKPPVSFWIIGVIGLVGTVWQSSQDSGKSTKS